MASAESVDLVASAGYRLRLPQEITASAVVFLYRFHDQRRASEDEDSELVATTCLFLAAKTGEHPRRLRDVINTVRRLRRADDGPMALDREYWSLKEKIVATEQRLLRSLGFDVHVQHPYRFMLNYARSLDVSCSVASRAWAYLNDCLWIPQLVHENPSKIACAALFLALLETAVTRPTAAGPASTPPPDSWWLVFGVQDDELAEVASRMLSEVEKLPREPEATPPPRAAADSSPDRARLPELQRALGCARSL